MSSRVLVLHTSNGDQAIDISTREAYRTVALSIVNDRLNRGFYSEPTPPTTPELTFAQVRKLPEGQFRNFGLAVWSRYRQEAPVYDRKKLEWDTIQKCLAESDGEAAISILEMRNDYQFEGFDILEVQTSYP